MNFENNQFEFISSDSKWYSQVVKLRYESFFKPLELPMDIMFDQNEENSIHLVCVNGKRLLGYGRLTISQEISQISQMVVNSSVRGNGIGTEIMKKIIDKAIQKNSEKIYLNARLNAIDFYRKFDFKTVGEVFPSFKTKIPHQRMEKSCK
ncbi:hypothetical protein C8C77_12359 [Halanaerobium saccharolyticum]|uniref:N-acetyltransferase domain-containing protein n=1 Tax=Halanaerobium saccharolyticum TaxID=43595 RepID=A0A4R7YTD7_9FIRM|nr:GNAT family N-acetyltransferase [Halanaerobium saccharolyticum]RAK06520.1 hypothetical protein C7958_12259 [Halanaerobium saccharolyticum]TDW01064.1 hypothetical protein C8C77_12359 [Halanaerobium saccharolyticum]TDX52645.1 hypothetical protein C7956_12259 [Halanaerobium saccharolyticum]